MWKIIWITLNKFISIFRNSTRSINFTKYNSIIWHTSNKKLNEKIHCEDEILIYRNFNIRIHWHFFLFLLRYNICFPFQIEFRIQRKLLALIFWLNLKMHGHKTWSHFQIEYKIKWIIRIHDIKIYKIHNKINEGTIWLLRETNHCNTGYMEVVHE